MADQIVSMSIVVVFIKISNNFSDVSSENIIFVKDLSVSSGRLDKILLLSIVSQKKKVKKLNPLFEFNHKSVFMKDWWNALYLFIN